MVLWYNDAYFFEGAIHLMTYYTATVVLCILSMITMQLCVGSSNTLSKTEKRHFRFEFGAIILAVACEWLGVLMDGTGEKTQLLHIFVKVVEFIIAPFIGIFMALILDAPGKKAAVWVLSLHALLEVILSFTGGIISVDANSVYTHGPLYLLYMSVYFGAIFYSIYAVLRSVRKYQYGGFSFLLGILLFTLSGFLFHILQDNIRLDYLTTAVSAIIIYVFTLDMIQQTDELTGLINRRGYENRLTHMTDPCVILIIDVDRFKSINDTYGHQAGDRCLRTVGSILRDTFLHYGKSYRIGGDEFCVILTSHTQWVEALIRDLEQRMEYARREDELLPSLSIGFAFYDPDCNSPAEAAEAADQMMYRRKLAKNAVRVD